VALDAPVRVIATCLTRHLAAPDWNRKEASLMKVAVSSSGPTPDSEVDPRFGRCPLLLIIDTESRVLEVLENPALTAPNGAGIRAAQTLAEKGANAIITGRCGPNAYRALSAADIHVAIGASGSVRQAVEAYQQGKLRTAGAHSVPRETGSRLGRRIGRGGRTQG
jgi:predicted Fe-Mo cluster-binding NifX family protein